MQAVGELWELHGCCGSNFTFLFLSFSSPFLFPSPLQVLSLDKSVSLLSVLSILPACLFPASAPFSGAGPAWGQAARAALPLWVGHSWQQAVPSLKGEHCLSLMAAGALECPCAWSLLSFPKHGSVGRGLLGCAGHPAQGQAGGWHCHGHRRCLLGSCAAPLLVIFLTLAYSCPVFSPPGPWGQSQTARSSVQS